MAPWGERIFGGFLVVSGIGIGALSMMLGDAKSVGISVLMMLIGLLWIDHAILRDRLDRLAQPRESAVKHDTDGMEG